MDILQLEFGFPQGSSLGPFDFKLYTKPKSQFLDEFPKYIDQCATVSRKLLVLGYFNIHVDDASDGTAKDLKDLVYSFNLIQHVHEPTYKKSHTLDLVISR